MSDNELMLLNNAIKGDIKSFELLIKKYQKYAYNISLKYLKDPNEAEDITQEALIKVFRNLKNFNMNSKFSTWLYRIVVNTCKDELRKKKREENVSHLDNSDEYINEVEDTKYEPLRSLEENELSEGLKNAVDELKLKYKEVIILCDVNGLSYNEISNILDIPVGTVRSRISRGRLNLRKIINEMELIKNINV